MPEPLNYYPDHAKFKANVALGKYWESVIAEYGCRCRVGTTVAALSGLKIPGVERKSGS